MLISEIVAPVDAHQVYVPPPQPPPRLDPVDLAIQQEVQRHGRYGCHIWKVLNAISRAEEPGGRDEERRFRLHLWHRLKGLLHRDLLFPFGRKSVSSVKVPRERAVRRKRRFRAGSTLPQSGETCTAPAPKDLSFNCLGQSGPVATFRVDAGKTQTAVTPEALSKAGRALAILPRKQRRKLTGLLHGKRTRRGQRILLPGGRQAFLWGRKQRKVVWSLDPNELLCGVLSAGKEWGVLPESEVTLEMNAAAVALGQGKRGTKEAPSTLKAASCRANGCRPVRPGRRPRGRPVRSAVS